MDAGAESASKGTLRSFSGRRPIRRGQVGTAGPRHFSSDFRCGHSKALLSIPEVKSDVKRWTDRRFSPGKQRGWLVCGLPPDDGRVYRQYTSAEYLPGYAAVPPMVHLRRGETLRRYLEPGLDDGRTFVFWGRNYNTTGIPGPERSLTWVNQPEKMYRSQDGTGYHPGQARYANAVYTYRPDFKSGDYREGVIEEDQNHVVFEFYTTYVIAAAPPNSKAWGIYEAGCRNGLTLHGRLQATVSLSHGPRQNLTGLRNVLRWGGLDGFGQRPPAIFHSI